MNILFSVAYNRTFDVPEGKYGGHTIQVVERPADWGLSGARKKLFHIKSAWNLARQARQFEALALCTVGIEAFFVGLFKRALCPRTRVVCADILIPSGKANDRRLAKWLGQLDAIVVIRRGDIETLAKRFGFPPSNCHFAFFPAATLPPSSQPTANYIYAAGRAHRDWATLLEALQTTSYPAILSPDFALEVPPELQNTVEVRPNLPPSDGRALMDKARLVVMPFVDTPLPSGPLVLLDAMAMGKSVVVSGVNGSRDYVENGKTAMVVPPGDAKAMRAAICQLMENHDLRHEIGANAREATQTRFTNSAFVDDIIQVCSQVKR